MLAKLKIKNFQLHKKLELAFSNRITTIIGASDTGKSSIIRALQWIVNNRPVGDTFIRHGSGKVSVQLNVDDNIIKRVKSKSKNYYKMNEKPFKAFRSDVPDKIKQTLNISDINFQYQHDSPFWFGLTAGEVSKQLNKIINLDIIDNTLANIASKLRTSKSTVEVVQERLKNFSKQKEETKVIKKIDEDLQRVEQANDKYEENDLKANNLRELVSNGNLLGSQKKRAKIVATNGNLALVAGESYLEKAKAFKTLTFLLKQVKDYKNDSVKRIPQDQIDLLDKAKETYEYCIEQVDLLYEEIKEVMVWKNEEIQARELLFQTTKELKKIKKCPLCGSQIVK